MQISTKKEELYINQVVGQKQETVMVEEDIVVPDIKPDIINTISTNGTICIYKKEAMDGKVRIDGCINTYIIYLPDDIETSVRGINSNIEFSKIIEIPSVKEGMVVDEKLVLKELECKVLNGRKISVKAVIDTDIKVLSNEKVDFINQVEDVRDIQLLSESMGLNSLLGVGSTKVYAKDKLMIDDIDNLLEILDFDVKIINKEIKISYNKVLVKADACAKILYLTEDNRVCKTSQVIPIMGFIDMQDISEDDICNYDFEIKNIVIKPNSIEERSIYVEIEIEINCSSYKTKQVNLIQDLYSPSTNLKFSQREIKAITEKKVIKDIYSIRENRNIGEIGASRIYDVKVIPNIKKQTIMSNRVMVEGETDIKFAYEGKNNSIDVKDIEIPFNYSMEIPGANKDSKVDIGIDAVLEDFTSLPDQSIDIKVDLEFKINLDNTRMINVIDNLEEDEIREYDRHSLVIYFIKPDDTLWKIAKRFHSTVENITSINQLEDESKLKVGEQLFIPISV